MQSSSQPSKYVVAFASGDTTRTELPAASPDPGRASQTLGFPPLSGQPPEAGGVAPQLTDFNGGFNQFSRILWWAAQGNGWAYDDAFAENSYVNGYPKGAILPSGVTPANAWLSLVESNAQAPNDIPPSWAPVYGYGALQLSGQSGGTVTLTAEQAAARTIIITGALSSNLVIIVPAWVREWLVYNRTTGDYSVVVKLLTGTGATIPQTGAPIRAIGNGTNVVTPAAADTGSGGRWLNTQIFRSSGNYTPTPGTNFVIVEAVGPGGSGYFSAGGGGGGAYARVRINAPTAVSVTVGRPVLATGSAGQGDNTTFGTYLSCEGGANGLGSSASASLNGGAGGSAVTVGSGAVLISQGAGQHGARYSFDGRGGNTVLGVGSTVHAPGPNTGAGAGGSTALYAGSAGIVIIYEYT